MQFHFLYVHNHIEGDIEGLPAKIPESLRVTGPVFHPYKSVEFPDHRVGDRGTGYPPCEHKFSVLLRRNDPALPQVRL